MCLSNKAIVWSGLVDLVAHGTGTVGVVGGFALSRVAGLFGCTFSSEKVPKRIGGG